MFLSFFSSGMNLEIGLIGSGATGGVGGYVYGATSTLFVGGIAAAAAFGLVKVLDPNAA